MASQLTPKAAGDEAELVVSGMLDETTHTFRGTEDSEYEVQEMIGKGASGSVHRGKCLKSGKFVAIKVIFGGGGARSDVEVNKKEDGFWKSDHEREAGVLRRLSHPNCVRFIGSISFPLSEGLVLEYLPGSLETRLLGPSPGTSGLAGDDVDAAARAWLEESIAGIQTSNPLSMASQPGSLSQAKSAPPLNEDSWFNATLSLSAGKHANAHLGALVSASDAVEVEDPVDEGRCRRRQETAHFIAQSIAHGMGHVHRLGLLHRDLKPASKGHQPQNLIILSSFLTSFIFYFF